MERGQKMSLTWQGQVGREEGNFGGDVNAAEFNHPTHDANSSNQRSESLSLNMD